MNSIYIICFMCAVSIDARSISNDEIRTIEPIDVSEVGSVMKSSVVNGLRMDVSRGLRRSRRSVICCGKCADGYFYAVLGPGGGVCLPCDRYPNKCHKNT